jgi:hypothetical protein
LDTLFNGNPRPKKALSEKEKEKAGDPSPKHPKIRHFFLKISDLPTFKNTPKNPNTHTKIKVLTPQP